MIEDETLYRWQRATRKVNPIISGIPEIVAVWGQSLSLGELGPLLLRNNANKLDRHGVMMVGGLERADTNGPVYVNGPMTAGYDTEVDGTGLVPSYAGGHISMTHYVGVALRIRRAMLGLDNPMLISCCNGIGGQKVGQFWNPPETTPPYAMPMWDMMDFYIDQVLSFEPSAICKYATFVQGEGDSNTAPGVYRAGVDQMWEDWLPIMPGTPIPCTTQVGGYCDSLNAKTYNQVTEQIESVEALGGLIFHPWYPTLLADGNVHPGDGGYREGSDLIAYHITEHEAGRTIPAFKPVPTLIGNQLILTYPLRDGETLVFNGASKYAPFGGHCENQGFEVTGANITEVGISGNQVIIDCDAQPTAWAYAFQFQNVEGSENEEGHNYSAHRGLLRKGEAIPSVLSSRNMYQWALSWRGSLI